MTRPREQCGSCYDGVLRQDEAPCDWCRMRAIDQVRRFFDASTNEQVTGEYQDLPVVGGVVGYIILTSHADGTWHDDWDGEVHVTRRQAEAAYLEAVGGMDDSTDHEDYFMLAQLRRVSAPCLASGKVGS